MLSPHVFTSYFKSHSLLTLLHWGCGTHAELCASFLLCPPWEKEFHVLEGIWRCFEVKNTSDIQHFLLHVVAVCRWMAGQPKLFDYCSAGCLWDFSTVFLSGRGLFTAFTVGHSFWRLRRLNLYRLQQFVCHSGCSLDWAAVETKGCETMQEITKLRGKINQLGWYLLCR